MKGAKTDTAKLGINLALEKDKEIANKTAKNLMPKIDGAYIRYKKINGKFYYYLVKTYWDNGKRFQKVLRYYGVNCPRKRG